MTPDPIEPPPPGSDRSAPAAPGAVPHAQEGSPRVERTTVVACGPGAEPWDDGESLRRALARLARLRSESLAPLRRTATVPGGVALTHLVPVDAVGLDDLRAFGPLRAGHVLAVATAVTSALVDLHRAGLAHGAVRVEHVLVALDGSVVLAATGAAWRRPPGEIHGPLPSDDVAAVGDLVRELLGTGSAPSALVLCALRAADSDPRLRPTAEDLLESLSRCGRPEPLLDALWSGVGTVEDPDVAPSVPPAPVGSPRVSGPPGSASRLARLSKPSTVPPVGEPGAEATQRPVVDPTVVPRPVVRRRGPRSEVPRVRLFAVAAVLAVGVPTAVVVGAGRSEGTSAALPPVTQVAAARAEGIVPTAAATVAAMEGSVSATGNRSDVDWRALLLELDRGRTSSLAVGSLGRLRDWVDPTGAAWAVDSALATDVRTAGARIDGGELVLEEVEALQVTADTAVLRVRDRRSAYTVVTAAQRFAEPAREPRWWTVTLRRSGAPPRWRIAEAVPSSAVLSSADRR